VSIAGCCTLTAQVATSSTSRSVPVHAQSIVRAASSTFASTYGLAALDDTDDALQGNEQLFAVAVSFMGI